MAKAQTSDDPLLPSKAQTFEFARRTFVSGLFWQPLPGATARIRATEVERMSEEQDFDLAVLRTSGVPQAGFGSLADGLRPGMLSVAAMVSKSLEVANRERSFLCAMAVPGGMWLYVAQREGVLLHDGDMLGDEETIRNRMMTDLSLIEWQTIFAPEHWGIPHSVEKAFEDLLPKHGNRYSFKSWWEVRLIRNTLLDRVKKYWPFLVVAAVAGVGYFGYSFWQQWKLDKEMAELAEQEAATQVAKIRAVADHPWKKQARAAKFVAACDAAIAQVNTFWPGNWAPKDAVCANGTLVVTWNRQDGGWIEHLMAIEPKAVPSLDGKSATLTLPVTLPMGDNETLHKERDRRLALVSAAQRSSINLNINDKTAGPTQPGQTAVPQDWKTLTWTIANTPLSPATLVPVFDGEGFRVTQIKLTFAGGIMNWTMEGNQYVQP